MSGKMAMPPSSSWLLSLPSRSQSVSCSRDPPTERENDPRVAASLLAALADRTGGRSRAGSQGGQLNEIASVERKLGDFLGGDDLAEGCGRGLDGDFGGIDLKAGAYGLGLESEIQLAVLVDLQAEIAGFSNFETGSLDLDREIANAEKRDEVTAGIIGRSIARDIRGLGSHGDFGAGDEGSGIVGHSAGKTSGGLSEEEWAREC
jgi:hypothetical protein